MATDNGLVTDAAAVEPAEFGVLSPAVTVVHDNDGHWSAGIDFPQVNCSTHVRLNAICSTASGIEVITPEAGAKLFRRYMPFDIETDFQCSTFGFDFLEYEKRARDYMEAAQQKAIEHELWTGELSKAQKAVWNSQQKNGESFPNQWLASPDAVDVTPIKGTPVKTKFALALLEDALGDSGMGIQGTIHATRGVASALAPKNENGILKTPLGNHIIAGAGYDGSGPNGTSPTGTAVWMYATGPVSVRLGPITATPDNRSQAVDIRNNEMHVYAHRPAAVSWDSCTHYAVLVDLSLDYA